MNRKARFPVPAFILKNLPHGMGEMFLFGQRVDPVVIRAFDFKWKHEHLGEALRSILEEPEPDIEPEDKA